MNPKFENFGKQLKVFSLVWSQKSFSQITLESSTTAKKTFGGIKLPNFGTQTDALESFCRYTQKSIFLQIVTSQQNVWIPVLRNYDDNRKIDEKRLNFNILVM